MRMRKGTHSCLSCRRRKVRCWYASPQATVCVQCARRKDACISQGDAQQPVRRPFSQQHTGISYDPQLDPFFKALHQLRRRVEDTLRTTTSFHADNRTTPSEFLLDHDSMQSSCAPVIKLLDHPLIGQRPELPHYQADQRARHPGCSSPFGGRPEPLQPTEYPPVLHEMCAALPPDSDIAEILMSRNQWWVLWRKSFGLTWGEEEDSTLTKFATRAVCTATPALLGSLLLCFALNTGTYSRYITPVERWMQADNFRMTHKYDFQCLMGLGLCLLSALQPLRAWSVYRKANALLQLEGIHRSRRRSKSLDLIFWQLFSADRWVSLLIGLPYSVPDHLCHLSITPITQSDPVIYHHRHMTVLTGRVIECLQSPTDFSFTAVVRVDEEIDNITAQLPANYLSMPHIAACPDVDEKYARLYRITEVFQLKTFLYLPLFLQHCGTDKQKLGQFQSALYGRTACLSSARSLIEAYLVLYDTNPVTATMDNSMKLTSFTALTAAVVLFLNLLAGDHSTSGRIADSPGLSTMQSDTALINRAAAVFEACSEGQSRSLCGQCHTALADLISCCQTLGGGESRKIAIPLFGMVEVIRKEITASTHSPVARISANDENIHTTSATLSPATLNFVLDDSGNIALPASTMGDDIFFSYYGPWESHQQEPCWPGEYLEANVSSSNMAPGQDYNLEFPL